MTASAHAINSVLAALATRKCAVSAHSTQSRGQSRNQTRFQSQSRLLAAPLQACRTSSLCSASYQLSTSFQVAGIACCHVSSTGLLGESPAYSGRGGTSRWPARAGLGTSGSGRRKANAQKKSCSPACGALCLAHRSLGQDPLLADAGSDRWHASNRSSTGGRSTWSRSWVGQGRAPFTHASHRQGGLSGFLSHCSVPCQAAGAPWLGLRTGGIVLAPAVGWHGCSLGLLDKKVGGASGRGDAPAVRCFAKKSSKSDWEKEIDKWRSTTNDWEKEVDKLRSSTSDWEKEVKKEVQKKVDRLAVAGGRTLEGMTAGGEEKEEVLSEEELEAMHHQGELESFDQRLSMRATAGGAAARLRPRDWTVGDVARWLQENGFARYAAAFLEHDVGGEVLLGLTAEELREELGMKSLGERKRFLAVLESVRADERAV